MRRVRFPDELDPSAPALDALMQTAYDRYARPGPMTRLDRHAARVEPLPHDLAGLATTAHGLLIHEHIAPAYGVKLTEERRSSVHLRQVDRLLDLIVADDDRPLNEARTADRRLPGNCRHFTLFAVAVLRARGVPARARCGFGDYFGTGWFEDHWVCECWHGPAGRWVLVDAQIDEVQRPMFDVSFDLLDVPRDRFLVAGDAWRRCRAGEDDAGRFGLSLLHESGSWWIAANLLRDVAALNGMEMLPWDVWGAMPGPDDHLDAGLVALLDRLAALTHVPDAHLDDLTALYESDERLRVPATVRNAVLGRLEPVA